MPNKLVEILYSIKKMRNEKLENTEWIWEFQK